MYCSFPDNQINAHSYADSELFLVLVSSRNLSCWFLQTGEQVPARDVSHFSFTKDSLDECRSFTFFSFKRARHGGVPSP